MPHSMPVGAVAKMQKYFRFKHFHHMFSLNGACVGFCLSFSAKNMNQ